MAQKAFIKSFEDFRGLDLRSSALTRKENYASQCVNMEIRRDGEGWALTGRKGYSVASQPTLSNQITEERCEYPYHGLNTYAYQDTNGQTIEELIGVGRGLYRLVNGTVALTYGGAGTGTFETYISNNQWYADLKVNGASQTGFPLALGTGENTSDTTLETLRTTINAVAGFACILTPWAQVNGNQTGAGIGQPAGPITVFAGHTVTVSTTTPTRIELNDKTGGTTRICRDVLAVTGTTITLQAPPGTSYGDIDVLNNDIIGIGLYPAALLGYVQAVTLTAAATTLKISYWERVYLGYFQGGSGGLSVMGDFSGLPNNAQYGTTYHNYIGVNKSNCFYFGSKTALNYHDYSLRTASGLFRYDGRTLHGADLPPAIITSAAVVAGGALGVGNYKYLVRVKHIDARGNIWYGPDNRFSYDKRATSLPEQYQNIQVTTTAGNTQVSLQIQNLSASYTTGAYQRAYLGAKKNGNQAMVAGVPLVCNVSGNTFRVGNTFTFFNYTDNRLQRDVVTAVGNGTVTFTPSRAGTLLNLQYLSNDLSVEIYRTKLGGNIFYKLVELPYDVTFTAAATAFSDTLADTALLEQYEDPIDTPPDPPPIFDYITTHQGLIVGIGDVENPQTVFWSLPGEDNGFPIATNSADINTQINDSLTCCISDSENMLAVFSNRTYTNITGDLATLTIGVDTTYDGDIGCPSPDSLIKIRNKIIFLSLKGFRFLSNGQMLPIEDRLASLFANQFYVRDLTADVAGSDITKFQFRRAAGVHDIENQRYICFVPKETGGYITGNIYPNNLSRCFTYDYQNDFWSEWRYEDNQLNGFLMTAGSPYSLNLHFLRRKKGTTSVDIRTSQLFKMNNLNNAYDYHDNCTLIYRALSPQWEFYNEPSIDKKFLHGKVWSLSALTPFVLGVKSYRNFSLAAIDTQTSLNFSGSDVIQLTWKFKENKCRSMQLLFENNEILKNPVISGYEYVVAIAYGKDDLKEIG